MAARLEAVPFPILAKARNRAGAVTHFSQRRREVGHPRRALGRGWEPCDLGGTLRLRSGQASGSHALPNFFCVDRGVGLLKGGEEGELQVPRLRMPIRERIGILRSG
jgi:hypothetical protein